MAYKPLWIAGLALMALSALIHAWSLHARDAGIRALQEAQRSYSPAPMRNALPSISHPAEPDTSSWSQQRITAYRAAQLEKNTPLALLRIPALNLVVPVFEGTSEWVLNRGAGRIEGTAPMGSEGNLGLAGHRDGFFRPLRNIQIGDMLIIEGTSASERYRVTDLTIVDPTEVGVLRATPTPTLTLVTCYPFYFIGPAPKRFIVHAARIGSSEALDQTAGVE